MRKSFTPFLFKDYDKVYNGTIKNNGHAGLYFNNKFLSILDD